MKYKTIMIKKELDEKIKQCIIENGELMNRSQFIEFLIDEHLNKKKSPEVK